MDKYQVEAHYILQELGIPAHTRGYEHIKTALAYLIDHPNSIHRITEELYFEVAKQHGKAVTPIKVERNIRTAIGMSRSNDATWRRVLGGDGSFTNAEFLATLSEVIKIRLAFGNAVSIPMVDYKVNLPKKDKHKIIGFR